MNILYNAAISLYAATAKALAPRNPKARKMIEGQRQTMVTLEQKRGDGEWVWIHASSLGEFEQGRPLIERLRSERPELKILLTFFSPSGYEVRKDYAKADVVCYLPFDKPRAVERFLDLARPSVAIFVKYEFWGNYLESLRRRGIPTYIISAIFRPGQVFFRPWGGMFRNMLRCFTHIFVQDCASRELLGGIGVEDVTVAGDTRFDRVADILRGSKPFPIVENFAASAAVTLIMGSSWQPDEDIVIPYFNSHPGLKLIIAPHEFDAGRLEALRARIGRKVGLYSETNEQNASQLDCLIIDRFGILSSCYRYASIAYVGGGFGAGIHNVNEAAVYGIPVIFGPRHTKFREAAGLKECGGGFAIGSKEEFNAIADRLTTDPGFLARSGKAAGEYIQSQLGATERVYSHIFR